MFQMVNGTVHMYPYLQTTLKWLFDLVAEHIICITTCMYSVTLLFVCIIIQKAVYKTNEYHLHGRYIISK